MLTLEWLQNNGGVEEIEKINNTKAKILYEEIDHSYKSLYFDRPKNCRS